MNGGRSWRRHEMQEQYAENTSNRPPQHCSVLRRSISTFVLFIRRSFSLKLYENKSLMKLCFLSLLKFLRARWFSLVTGKTSDNDDDHVRDTASYVVQRDERCMQTERALKTVSVLLQYEVLQLICRSQQEGRRLTVSRDQLTHCRYLCMAELS